MKATMFTDIGAFDEHDHVVPGTSIGFNTPLFSNASTFDPVLNTKPADTTTNTLPRRQISLDLWADIESLLNSEDSSSSVSSTTTLECDEQYQQLSESGLQDPGTGRKFSHLKIQTPDFAALISEDQLLAVDTPTPSTSPAPQEVPKLSRSTTLRNLGQPPVNTLNNLTVQTQPHQNRNHCSLMESSLLISNSLAAGCAYQEYGESPDTYEHLDISRTLNGASMEMCRTLDFDMDPEGFGSGVSTSGGILDDMKERIKYACTVADIPVDPNTWTSEHVKNWVLFVMKQYGVILDPEALTGLTTDGRTLVTMPKEDFVSVFPNIGETLYSEMELWCFAFPGGHVMTTPMSNPIMPSTMSDVTYTDLDAFKTASYDTPMSSAVQSLMPMTSPIHCASSSVMSQSAMMPNMCSTSTSPMYIKQERRDQYENCQMTDLSPASSPECTLSTRFSNYSSSPSSCGYTSCDDTFEDRDLKPHLTLSTRGKHTIQLWMFLKELLLQPQYYEAYIRWLDRGKGVFKIEDSAQVAKLWGRRKNRPHMNYDKLSRSIRQYYKKGIIKKTVQSKRLVYQFCPQYNG